MPISLTIDLRTPNGGFFGTDDGGVPGGALVTLKYDRDVRDADGTVPAPAQGSVVVSGTTDPVVSVPFANDDAAVSDDSQGFAIIIGARWRQGTQVVSWSKTVAIDSSYGSAVSLSDLADAQPVPPQQMTVSGVLAVANQAVSDAQAAETSAASSADSAAASAALVGAPAGTVIDAHLGGDSSAVVFNIASNAPHFDAERFKTGSRTDLQAIQAACSGATTFSQAAIVRLSSRTWDVGNGLSMSGYSCGLEGLGSGHAAGVGGKPTGTVLYASTQNGPVLDLTGWLTPDSFRGMTSFGAFALRGSGVADATKANIGLKRGATALGSVNIHDITISQTGGPCLDLYRLYLSQVNRVTCVTPVGANANDVPYVVLRGCNANTISGLGFRSMSSTVDTGVSGAFVITDDGGSPSYGNAFFGMWFEYLHIPTGGTLINHQGCTNAFTDTSYSDVGIDAGATGTSYWTLGNVAHGANSGGNIIRGLIPGGQAGTPQSGIVVYQSNNRIEGVKGYNGNNVTLNAGVQHTFASLGGAVSGASGTAFVDNSGNTTNVLMDYYAGTLQHNAYTQTAKSVGSGQSGPQFTDNTNSANGAAYYGTGGVKTLAIGTTVYRDAATHIFRDLSGVVRFQVGPSTGPGLTLKGPLQLAARTVTASTSATSTDGIIIANGSSITVTLPSASMGAGSSITVKNINATTCTVGTLASQAIDGGTTDALAQWDSRRYVSTGLGWVKA